MSEGAQRLIHGLRWMLSRQQLGDFTNRPGAVDQGKDAPRIAADFLALRTARYGFMPQVRRAFPLGPKASTLDQLGARQMLGNGCSELDRRRLARPGRFVSDDCSHSCAHTSDSKRDSESSRLDSRD